MHLLVTFSIGIIKPTQVVVSGPNLINLEKWRVLGANVTEDNGVVVTKCDIIFICVKPHLLQTCASQVESSIERNVYDKDKLFVSVLAGVTLDQLELVGYSTFKTIEFKTSWVLTFYDLLDLKIYNSISKEEKFSCQTSNQIQFQ